jgi:hypothetical protein
MLSCTCHEANPSSYSKWMQASITKAPQFYLHPVCMFCKKIMHGLLTALEQSVWLHSQASGQNYQNTLEQSCQTIIA